VNALAVDPRNSQVVYAGVEGGGVWKTTDGGGNWVPLTDQQPSMYIDFLRVHPQNPETVYGAATRFFSSLGPGILKTTDGGGTWTHLPIPFGSVSSITLHPTNSQILLAAGVVGIYRSTDGGSTWTRVLWTGGLAWGVAFDPLNGSRALEHFHV